LRGLLTDYPKHDSMSWLRCTRDHATAFVAISGMLCMLSAGAARAQTVAAHTLSDALVLGARRALSVVAARARSDASVAEVRRAEASYYPSVSVNLSGTGNASRTVQPLPPPNEGLFPFASYSGRGAAAASLRWLLFDFGQTSGLVESARATRDSASAGASGVQLAVSYRVTEAYLSFEGQQRLLAAVRATLEQRARSVEITHGLVAAGMQPALEELQAAARVSAAQLQLTNAEAAVDDARITLAELLVVPETELRDLRPARLTRLETELTRATLVADALPAVREARANHRAKAAALAAAKARYLPALSLAIDAQYEVSRYDEIDAALEARSATGMLVASLPLFDASIGAGVDSARAQASAAQADAEQSARTARGEWQRARVAWLASTKALLPAQAAAQTTGTVLAIVQARYARGLSSSLERIQAETADRDARSTQIEVELTHALALVRACEALGRPITEDP
jgi:outer membrane protein TolC